MYKVIGNTLQTDSGAITFSKKIWNVTEQNEHYFVLMEFHAQPDDIDNIYCVFNGKIIWRVQNLYDFDPGLANPLLHCCSVFSSVEVFEKDSNYLVANETGGFRYLIDPANGKIIREVDFVK